MNIIHYTLALVVSFSFIFAGEVEAKSHGSKQARERVLKEMTRSSPAKAK